MTYPGSTARLLLKCLEPERCSVVFEPYGAEFVLEADDQLRLEIDSGEDAALEIAYSPGCISIWLPESTVSVRATNRLHEPVNLGLPL